MRRGLLITLAAGALSVGGVLVALAADRNGGAHDLLVGVVEDAVQQPDPAVAAERMAAVKEVGFGAIRITTIWSPGETELDAGRLAVLRNVASTARPRGIRVFVAVYHAGSRTTPLTEEDRESFASFAASIAKAIPSFRDFIVGNEPNLNRFWMPQYSDDGSNAAAPAYLELLAETYDALKAVSPDVTVVGGALAPRGSDRADLPRHTHSPTAFIRDLGRAYRASGRDRPIMDWLAIHPYETNSSVPPGNPHPDSTTITLGDYEKLVRLLDEAFDETPQPGSSLPILYAEFGVETRIPVEKLGLHEGAEPATIEPVDEGTQAGNYRRALELAACQPTVVGIFLFHVYDEIRLEGWQSGVRYVDGSPKESLGAVSEAVEAAAVGELDDCD